MCQEMKKLVCGHCGKEFATISVEVYEMETLTDQVLNIYDEATGKIIENVIVFDEVFYCADCAKSEFAQCEYCGAILEVNDDDIVYLDEVYKLHTLCCDCYEARSSKAV